MVSILFFFNLRSGLVLILFISVLLLTYCVCVHSEFDAAFLDAQKRCTAHVTHCSFNTSTMEIAKDDIMTFLRALCD